MSKYLDIAKIWTIFVPYKRANKPIKKNTKMKNFEVYTLPNVVVFFGIENGAVTMDLFRGQTGQKPEFFRAPNLDYVSSLYSQAKDALAKGLATIRIEESVNQFTVC